MRVEELAKSLDHALLVTRTSGAALQSACEAARELHLAAVCAIPAHVEKVTDLLRGSDVKSGVVAGLPDGSLPTADKIAAVEAAVRGGAGEVDVVMNLPMFLSGRFGEARDDLARVVRSARSAAAGSGRGTVIVKAIIEAPRLDDKLVRLACKVVAGSGADFAGTSTCNGGEIRVQDVELMRESLNEEVGVAAAGGISTLDQALAMIDAGAARVCSTNALEIVREMAAAGGRR